MLGLLSASVLGAGVAVRQTPQVAAQGKMPSKQDILDRIQSHASLDASGHDVDAQVRRCRNTRCSRCAGNGGFIEGLLTGHCWHITPNKRTLAACERDAVQCGRLAVQCEVDRATTCVDRWINRWVPA